MIIMSAPGSGCQVSLGIPTGETATTINESTGAEVTHTRLNFSDSRQKPSHVLVTLHHSVTSGKNDWYQIELAIVDKAAVAVAGGRSLSFVADGKSLELSTRESDTESTSSEGWSLEKADYPLTADELRRLAEADAISMTVKCVDGSLVRREFDDSHKAALHQFYQRFAAVPASG